MKMRSSHIEILDINIDIYCNIYYTIIYNMYKTVSIHNNTYQQLNILAAKLQKPKSQVIHDLIYEYIERMNDEEKNSLKSFNASVKKLTKRVKLPRGFILTYDNMDTSGLMIHNSTDTSKSGRPKTVALSRDK